MERLRVSNKLTPGFKAVSLRVNVRRTLQIPGAPQVLPLICYEIVFPGDIAAGDDRPGWIVNLTNDGWFGISTGPYQHLQQARLRAIEQGLPVVRAANTGILGGDRSGGTDLVAQLVLRHRWRA